MSFTVRTEEEFVPTTIHNPDSESPIKFILKYLNSIERDGIIALEFIDGKSHGKVDFIRACRVGILRIENLIVNDKAIKTADEFLRGPFHDTMLEVGKQIVMMNPLGNEEDLKNLP
jgi:hypothetical protein